MKGVDKVWKTKAANTAVNKILIDKDMKKKDLEFQAKISHYTINKLNRGENVNVDTLEKICRTLNCSIEDIVEFVPDK